MDCFDVKTHDRVLIVSNPPQRRVAKALFDTARERGDDVRHMEYATLGRHGEEPPGLKPLESHGSTSHVYDR
jgi:hypothetical protein